MAVIVSIIPYRFLPAKIGGQKGIALFNKYLAKYCSLICVTVKSNENQKAEGYETAALFSDSKTRYFNPLLFFTIGRFLKKKKATHLLLEHPYYGWLGMPLKWILGLKLIIHSHNIEAERWKGQKKWWWKIMWVYEKWVHRLADYNFFIQENDRQYAINQYNVAERKCIVVTYGIENDHCPATAETIAAKEVVRKKHNVLPNEKLLLFAGSYDYKPNLLALDWIEKHIVPELNSLEFSFKILVCGPWLKDRTFNDPRIIYTGFVDDIYLYFRAADVFINPVTEGGGIKTKLVESLGQNTNVVSTIEGAIGVDPALCNRKLAIVPDFDWQAFAAAIVKQSEIKPDIPPVYFQHFYWGFSVKKAAEFIGE